MGSQYNTYTKPGCSRGRTNLLGKLDRGLLDKYCQFLAKKKKKL